MPDYQIGVVIPSYNDWPFLEKLLDSLFSQPAGTTFLPVIVDDQSTGETSQKLSELRADERIVVLKPTYKARFTRCCNAGINWLKEHIGPEYYFLLNSDTQVTAGWAGELLATSTKLGAGIVGATLLLPSGRIQHLGAYGVGYHYEINKPWIRHRQDRLVPWVTGAAMLIRSDVVNALGYLPVKETVQYDGSDRDYCIQARRHGIEIAISTGAVIYHFTHEIEAIRKGRGDYG